MVQKNTKKGFTLIQLTKRQFGQARTRYLSGGFTLIELMIVIAIIAGLATMFISTFPAGQKRSRDTARRSDLKQYQTALELYANRTSTGAYPTQTSPLDPSTTSFCQNLGLTGTCPTDPKTGTNSCSAGSCGYNYVSSANGSLYSLWTRLESPSNNAAPFYILCSSGIAKESATAPTSASICP